MQDTISEKIRFALIKRKMNICDLADAMNQSRQNLSNKLSRNNFTINELTKIAEILGCIYNFGFEFPDGTKI